MDGYGLPDPLIIMELPCLVAFQLQILHWILLSSLINVDITDQARLGYLSLQSRPEVDSPALTSVQAE